MLTEQTTATTIFELLESAFSVNPKRALKLYNDQRLQKVEPEEILAMISWQLSVLAIYMYSKNLPTSEVIAKSGVSPYTLSKARGVAEKLSFTSLKTMVSDLANLDFAYKTSSLDLDEGLKNFIVTIGELRFLLSRFWLRFSSCLGCRLFSNLLNSGLSSRFNTRGFS